MAFFGTKFLEDHEGYWDRKGTQKSNADLNSRKCKKNQTYIPIVKDIQKPNIFQKRMKKTCRIS